MEKLVHKQSFDPSKKVDSTGQVSGLLPQINTLMPKVIAKIRKEAEHDREFRFCAQASFQPWSQVMCALCLIFAPTAFC
ncbi:hypothetical protein OH492_14790 [Vibrio chagasii]|nr:hypothetical protein [Vibrio chagasii]